MCFDRVFLNVLARVCALPCMHMTIYREAQRLHVTNSNLRYLWARANEQNKFNVIFGDIIHHATG